ncbi:MAG: KH domain-containing protein [Acidilobaceae archaeon]|nr:KH domain-containing protein [Acidilobaceae archaeon]
MRDEGIRQRLYVKIPPERLGAVIGEEGRVKREIEERLDVSIKVDSENSMAIIEAREGSQPINVMKAGEIIKAISYGFPPEKAMALLMDDQVLIYVDLREKLGDKPNHIRRVKARIIGEEGRARRTLEQLSGTYIQIGEDFVAIVGEYERAMAAKEAVEMLIDGRAHSTVYRHLESLMRSIKKREKFKL